LTWWCTCEDNYNHLQELAIKLFSVVPHSAGCERNFSNLGWLYGTRRHNLNLEKVEDMSKTYSYYLAQTKKEIQYDGQKLSEEELKKLINDSGLISDDSDDDDTIMNYSSGEDEEILNNAQHQFLDICEIMDLNNEVFCDSNGDVLVESSVETNRDESIYEFFDNDYDPRDLVNDLFVENELESEHNSPENGYNCEVNETDIYLLPENRNNYLEEYCNIDVDNILTNNETDNNNNLGNNTNIIEGDNNNSQKLVRKNANQKKHNLRSSSQFGPDKRINN